ncbi:uncharacterized protein BDW43DRAFT_144123 [Aspergillus alliaceus]|uniref:uncharacterized protein n=1 Tax=Petromyces alliaceus TaxID=209559 RepID=UPI0012A6419D|nr:uncharacterized protein BDW43DRAFT_144123 [Aspergillus alliaceus]KAB8231037.1 hypothetical protein BDW43DRAFT_144123 [Aspergillus alliaceus]
MGRLDTRSDTKSHRSQYITTSTWCVVSCLCMVLLFICMCFPLTHSPFELGLLYLFIQRVPFHAYSKNLRSFEKPKDLKIIALVPFRSHERTEILDCYLRRNLVDDQGFLDLVIFIPQMNDTESLEWLTSVVERTPRYRISETADYVQWGGTDKNVMLIKIDGDIIFLEDHTIPTIVKTKLDHPGSLIVSANVINQAALQTLHSHPGIALPYLPEVFPSSDQTQDWRVVNLPPWEGPADFKIYKGYSPPSKSHRWLPLTEENGDRTPIATSMYDDNGPGLDDWTVHAQQHYSFLQHLESGDLYRYKFPMWVNPTESVGLNFLCLEAGDPRVIDSIIEQDVDQLAMKAAQEVQGSSRDVIIDGKGLAAHYSADASLDGLDSTDILCRYRAYAKEVGCLENL